MRRIAISYVPYLTALMLVPPAIAEQEHHGAADSRAANVMGFDQDRTAHHFFLFRDGGAIEVSAKETGDVKNRDAIRSHLPHIASMFGRGEFDAPMLVHDSENVPGTKVMAARREHIRYEYVDTPRGGRVNILSSDPEAVSAVHQFLKFQIAEHKTGDPTVIRTR